MGGEQQVVGVQGVGAPQFGLVGAPFLGGHAGNVWVRLLGEPSLDAEHLVLGGGDLGVESARPAGLFAASRGGAEESFDDAAAVGGVVDGEGRGVAEGVTVAAQDASAGGVKGHEPEPPARLAGQGAGPGAHLLRGLIVKVIASTWWGLTRRVASSHAMR